MIIVGLSFLDRYAPSYGLAWNIINGTITGLAVPSRSTPLTQPRQRRCYFSRKVLHCALEPVIAARGKRVECRTLIIIESKRLTIENSLKERKTPLPNKNF